MSDNLKKAVIFHNKTAGWDCEGSVLTVFKPSWVNLAGIEVLLSLALISGPTCYNDHT